MIELVVCTVIWGASFLAQKLGADHFGPFAINCYRNVLGGAFLLAGIAVRDRRRRGGVRLPSLTRAELVGGAMSGLCLFCAMMAQQLGIEKTTPGISAFLTANYILLVPVLAWLLRKGRPGLGVWLGVALAMVGSFFICIAQGTDVRGVGTGELWTLACALLFAVQIMVVDHFARDVDVIKFSMMQLFTAAAVALPFVFLPSELARASWPEFLRGFPAMAFLGVMSSGIAYTLQNLGQAKVSAAVAALVMSMESVFAALFGWLLLGDVMTVRQLLGCGCVFAAVLCSQLHVFRRT